MNSVADKADSFPNLLYMTVWPQAGLELLSGLKSSLRSYHQHRPLEICSHTNYNTAVAEVIEHVLADTETKSSNHGCVADNAWLLKGA